MNNKKEKSFLTGTTNQHEQKEGVEILSAKMSDDYNIDFFEKFFSKINLSNDNILGINWELKDEIKIEKQLFCLGFKIKENNKRGSTTGFLFSLDDQEIEGFFGCFNDHVSYTFSFIHKKSGQLIELLNTKYGVPLSLRRGTVTEYENDWIYKDILIAVEMNKFSGYACITFEKCPDYIKKLTN